jgi:hypothetical protein
MLQLVRLASLLLAVVGLAAGTAGCGGSDPSGVVGAVGERTITRSEVNHWMGEIVGGEFYELSHGRWMPLGLVSDPPNYQGCVRRVESILVTPSGRVRPSGVDLLTKCRELHQAVKSQAMGLLVALHWTVGVLGEVGLHVSEAQTQRALTLLKAQQFPKQGAWKQYLASRRRTVADELALLKLDLLGHKAERVLHSKQGITRVTEAEQRWTAKTTCTPGYVVKSCKQYVAQQSTSTSPPSAALLEQLASITGTPCINKPACG